MSTITNSYFFCLHTYNRVHFYYITFHAETFLVRLFAKAKKRKNMKKILAIAVFLIAFSSAFASIDKPSIFGISIDEGYVILKGDNAPDFGDYSESFTQVSFNAIIGFNSRIGIHTGLGLLFDVGTFINGEDDSSLSSLHSSSDPKDNSSFGMALNIPAMARFYASKAFFLEAGATFDINLFEVAYLGEEDEWSSNDEQNLLNVEIGAGLGFTLGFGLEFSFKYTHGLTNMNEHGDISNSRLILGIAYWFNYR